ncbi:MAG: DUF2971 domain-containing protein [Prolixibacteraceae bacterium]|nr:DUF2971 domain-containing protein [Prolixibacteraceae bacterium]
MLEIKTQQLTPDILPVFLYKYRSWEDNYHRRIITHQEIYFAQPSSFNDPFDGNIPIRWDLLTYEDCFQKNLELVQMLQKDEPLHRQKLVAKRITDSKQLWHPDTIKKESPQDIEKWDRIIGLLSLSEKRDDILMWSHYSNFHKGFVVGFHTNSLLNHYDFDFIGKVKYQEDYPLISGYNDTDERFKKKFFTKSNAWSYENEWRLSKNHITNRIIKLKKESFAEIVIGCQMGQNEKTKIIKEIRDSFGDNIKILEAKKSEENFKLEFIEL